MFTRVIIAGSINFFRILRQLSTLCSKLILKITIFLKKNSYKNVRSASRSLTRWPVVEHTHCPQDSLNDKYCAFLDEDPNKVEMALVVVIFFLPALYATPSNSPPRDALVQSVQAVLGSEMFRVRDRVQCLG